MVNFKEIADKWQNKWEKSKIFKVKENKKKKFYCLEMFPYPSSGVGLHMGHLRNYTIVDCYARFKRMQGFNVLYPAGYDAFGLPAENAAIKEKKHPKIFTESAIANSMKQQKQAGLSYDWDRLVVTCYPEYYKWNQWFFLKFLEKGLAYRKKAPVNYCESCGTVLANEQVVNGKCWRCHNDVTIKQLEQWFLKITDYADELLKDLEKIDWPERIKIMQRNWIGKSSGTLVNFKLKDNNQIISVFTTRPDTLYGVTFLVFAPEHPLVLDLVKNTVYEDEVKKFINKVIIEEKFTRADEDKEKEGMFIGKYAINPLTNEEIPIYIANFALLEYGTGIVMGVPAHDARDFAFAKKYNIKIKVVIKPEHYDLNEEKMIRAYVDEGILVNSNEFNGMNNLEAIDEITKYLEKKKLGKKTIQYKIRDWLISRQRYWGTPIPVVYCDKCGIISVNEKELPLLLPENVKFTGQGNPLQNNEKFVNTKCPKCRGKAKRETDTMDTFVDSSWYFLRYCSNKYSKGPFDKLKIKYWMPVDLYVGGAEHAVMHLIYSRFFVKALRDMKLLNFNEPFNKLFNQGMLHKDKAVMSKSRGNIVTQQEIAKKYGIDTARFFLLFVAGPDKDMEWDDKGIEGSYRILNKIYNLTEKVKSLDNKKDKNIISKLNKTIRDVTEHIDKLEFNLALISINEFVNYFNKNKEFISKKIYDECLKKLILMISPFVPHLAEDMWEKIKNKNFVSVTKWPDYDIKKIDYKIELAENMIEKTINDIKDIIDLIKIKPKEINIFVAEKWLYDLYKQLQKEKSRNIGEIIKKVIIKEHEQEISKIIQFFIKDPSRVSNLLDQYFEFKCLQESRDIIEKEFNCKVNIIKAENSNEQKAKQAMPNKPAILIR